MSGRTSRMSMTPLHIACLQGNLDVAQGLHSAGASLDARDTNGNTPLHVACYPFPY